MEYKLSDLTKIYTGKLNANAATPNGKYPFFTCSKEISKINSYSYNCECILVAGNGDLNVKYFHGKFDAYQRTYIIENKRNDIMYMPYLYYFMSLYISKLRNQTSGGVIKYIKLNNLTDIIIELPEVDVQKEIVEKIKKVQKVRVNKGNKLVKFDTLIKARFVEMFGDPVLNSKKYPEKALANYINFITSGSRGWSKYLTPKGKAWFLTIKNVKNSHIAINNIQSVEPPDSKEAQRTKVKEGDLLISITADLGRTGVVSSDIASHGTYINQHLTCIRLDTEFINPVYASYFLESVAGKRQFNSKNQNGVKAGLNFDAIKSLKIIIPPIKKQNSFVSFVRQVDKSKVAVQKSLEETQKLYDSLMQEYFG